MRQVRETLWIGDCIDARRYHDDFEIFKNACIHLREKYDEGLNVLIHCQAGVSRSTSVATAMLAVKEGKDWLEVLRDTRAGHAPVSPELIQSGKQYVEVCSRHE